MKRALTEIRDILILAHGPLAGIATGLVLLTIGADTWATTVVSGGVAIALILLAHFARSGERSGCEHTIAAAVRSILDRSLALTRIDPVGFGDFVTLRHLAAVAERGRLAAMITYGGPAYSLSRELAKLVSELEEAVSRCYVHLPARSRKKVDAFATALASARAAAGVMTQVPLVADPADRPQREKELYDDLGTAVVAVVSTGDGLDEAFDHHAFLRANVERAKSDDESMRREGHAAAVLLKNARDAGYILGVMHVQQPVRIGEDRQELTGRVEQARNLMLHVDAEAFHDATDAARTAHRQLTYHDLGEALEALRTLERTPDDAEADALMRERLGRFHTDLAALEAIRR